MMFPEYFKLNIFKKGLFLTLLVVWRVKKIL